MLFSKSVGAACALAFASVSAVAGGQSSASLSNLRFSLIDLDVEDNWTASYSLASGSSLGALSRASVRVGDQGIADGEPMYDWMSSPAPFDAVDARAAIGGAYAQASIDGGTLAASGGFDSGGALAQYDANASTGGTSTAYAPGGLWTLSVSPRTVLLVSVDASASAWAGNLACETGTEANNFGSDCGPEVAVGIASMALNYRYEDGSTTASYSYSDAVRAQANVRSAYGGFRIGPEGPYRILLSVDPDQAESNNRTLTAVFANTTDQWQQGNLWLNVTAFGYGTSPIPEASTVAMFGLGLLALHGLRGRRPRAR